MSSIEKMLRCVITGVEPEFDMVLRRINDSGCFHITAPAGVSGTGTGEDNPYAEPLRCLSEISALVGYKPTAAQYDTLDNEATRSELEALLTEARELAAELRTAEDKLNSDTAFFNQISHLEGDKEQTTLEIDVKQVFNLDDNGNIKIRFGRMPQNSYEKMGYYAERGIYFWIYGSDKDYKYGFVFFPEGKCAENDRALESLYFERMHIPEYLHGDLETVKSELSKKLSADKSDITLCRQKIESYRAENADKLNTYFTFLKTCHDIYKLRDYAEFENDRFTVYGFIPASEEKSFRSRFEDVGSAVIETENITDGKGVPVKLKANRFEEPFSMFVKLYGLPGYKDLNPTTFLAISYTLLFGIMFGDLGQGLLVMIAGFIIAKKSGSMLGRIMKRLGVSSMIFGTLYGSVFGFEEVLDPVYESLGISFLPFKTMKTANINTILYAAIGIGILIIIIAILVNIVMGIKTHDMERALFSNNGAAGLVFYTALLMLLLGPMLGIKTGGTVYVLLLIILPLLIMFFKEPLASLCAGEGFKIEGKAGDFIATSFFECFEYLLGFATNTLSFVRVGGFVLSHAGMMSVVLALSAMAGAGSPIVIILGNLFVMCLEGLLVGIQVLRLEYYEMFSRYYTGGGTPFTPVSVNFSEMVN